MNSNLREGFVDEHRRLRFESMHNLLRFVRLEDALGLAEDSFDGIAVRPVGNVEDELYVSLSTELFHSSCVVNSKVVKEDRQLALQSLSAQDSKPRDELLLVDTLLKVLPKQ